MAKRKDPVQERQRKRELWIDRTMQWSGLPRAEVETILARTRTQSFRLNPLVDGEVAPKLLSRQVAWCPDGYEIISPSTSLIINTSLTADAAISKMPPVGYQC